MRPDIKHLILEFPRTLKTLYSHLEARNEKLHTSKQYTIIVLPGLFAGDWSTIPLRKRLQNHGYNVYGWKQGSNIGLTPDKMKSLISYINKLHNKHKQPIILIGWSLGGIYARELSRMIPEVKKVITLGSPFSNLFSNYITDIIQFIHHDTISQLRTIDMWISQPLHVPSLNIFTKRDGVVHWTSCFKENDPNSEIKEVFSSHTGLGFDPEVINHIIDFLEK